MSQETIYVIRERNLEIIKLSLDFVETLIEEITFECNKILICIKSPVAIYLKKWDGKKIHNDNFLKIISYTSSTTSNLNIKKIINFITIKKESTKINILNNIVEFINHWKLSNDWKFHVKFLTENIQFTDDNYVKKTIYQFQCTFCKPTIIDPTPSVVVNVYFTIESNYMVSSQLPIYGIYKFEYFQNTSYLINNEFNFQSKLLTLILEKKLFYFNRFYLSSAY